MTADLHPDTPDVAGLRRRVLAVGALSLVLFFAATWVIFLLDLVMYFGLLWLLPRMFHA